MEYPWSKRAPLTSLSGSGSDGVLTFKAGPEKAVVRLEGQSIAEVAFFHQGAHCTLGRGDAKHLVVGEKNWQRDVYHFLGPGGPAPTMRLGYTVHRGEGTWSSLPHEFEKNPEPGFEEIFFYRLQGGSRRALQVGRGLWCDATRVDSVWPVNHDTFGVVPMGYHPVVGEPGVQVMYVWVYLAKTPKWEKI